MFLRTVTGAALLALACLPAFAVDGRWSGTLMSDDGEQMDHVHEFDAAGRWIFHTASRDGPRAWPIARVGQVERWRLPRGGYGVLTVEELTVERDHVSATLALRYESGDAGTAMEQEIAAQSIDFRRQGNTLATAVVVDSTVTRTSMFGVREQRSVRRLEGSLHR